MHKNPVLVAAVQTQTLLFQSKKKIPSSKMYVEKQQMEKTNTLRNSTTKFINTISVCSKINLISHLSVSVVQQVLSNLEATFHYFGPELLVIYFYQPRNKIFTTPDKTCLGFPWPNN